MRKRTLHGRYLVFICLFFLYSCTSHRSIESPYLVAQRNDPLPRVEVATHPAISSPPATLSPSTTPPQRRIAKSTHTIFIDAGHGGTDRGTACKNKQLPEKSLTLEMARRVERLLTTKGYRVFMSRRKDVFIPLPDRVKMADTRHAEVFVSIHFNFTKNAMIQGTEIFYFSDPKRVTRTKQSRQLGTSIIKKMIKAIPTPSRGVKSGDFCVIRETSMPAVLVEVAFLSNPSDVQRLMRSEHRNKIAQSIAEGIEEYFCKK